MTKMTRFFFTTIAALSTLSFASMAHAGNAFNKYSPTTTTSAPVKSVKITANTTTQTEQKSKRRIIRVVEPLPRTHSDSIRLTADHGTKNRVDGFNKMSSQTGGKALKMPIYLTKGAKTAR